MSTIDYHLLLTELFHDSPLLGYNALQLFPTMESFTHNLEANCIQLHVKSSKIEDIKRKLSSFNPVSIRSKLNDNGIGILCYSDPLYPQQLKEIYAPPHTLYFKGNSQLLNQLILSVVGSRHPSDYGKYACKNICRTLSYHMIIASGLAIGIDTIAHETSLEENNPTIAVIANGCNVFFPKSNARLYNRIEKNGIILSEHPLNTSSLPFRFPLRNRIISGISKGVLVIQAAKKSGSLITARYATEQNRDVFAIPGPINDELSSGPNSLIQDGAKLVQSHNPTMRLIKKQKKPIA